MRIAVNTRFLLPGALEGFGVFTHEVLKRLATSYPQHEFIFLFDRPYDNQFLYAENVKPVVIPPQARHPFLWYAWFEWSVPFVLKRYQPDIFLSPDGYLSLRTQVKSVPVIHDLAFEHYPRAVPWLVSQYYRYYFPKFAAKAEAIATVSTFTKNDLQQQYGVPPGKVSVIYNGASAVFQPLSKEHITKVKDTLTGGFDYFIYAGAIHQRKNVTTLLKAFESFKNETNSAVKLVIAGRKAWGNRELEKLYGSLRFQSDVIFTGSIGQKAMASYIGSALALTYLSRFEGFGLPLLEAMQCHVPVIISNAASLPEVAGNAGLSHDPDDVEGVAGSMAVLAYDAERYQELVQHAKKQSQGFSWDQTAERLWHVLKKAANS